MNGLGGASVTDLFRTLGPGLRLYARQWVGASTADDVVQEVFVRLLSSGKLPNEPRTWLYRCVRNAAISASRAGRRRGNREQAVASDAATWFVPRPEDRIDAIAAQEAMSTLPADQREIVTLRIWSGLKLAEIREVTGLPTSTIHDQFRAALATLRSFGVIMQEDQQLNEDQNRLIQTLSGLLPGAPDISEQAIWYEAGLRAGRRQLNVWRGVAAAVILMAGGALVMRPNATPVNVVRVQPSTQTPGAGSSDVTQFRSVASVDYLQLRDAVEQRGMEALPQSGGSGVLSQPAQTVWPTQLMQPGLGESLSPKGSL